MNTALEYIQAGVPALSLWQPWAWAIFNGKCVENRDWRCHYRGQILIHAAKTFDEYAVEWIESTFGLTVPKNLDKGGIVGVANVVDCVTESRSNWFFGKYGIVLEDQKPLPFFPCRGRQMIFKVKIPDQQEKRLWD